MSTPIELTLIESTARLTKKITRRGNGLAKDSGGQMYAGYATPKTVDGLKGLADLIAELKINQALTFGTIRDTVKVDQQHMIGLSTYRIVTKAKQIDGKNIARSRDFFHFRQGRPGILLLDYDPVDGEKPLNPDELLSVLESIVPKLHDCEVLISASASSHIYANDGTLLKGAGGLHCFVKTADASEIPDIGAAIFARCWLAGLGYIQLSKPKDSKTPQAKSLRTIIDASVWQPERLSFDAGAACGAGLYQKRPAPMYRNGRGLVLEDVRLTDAEWEEVKALQDAARGLNTKKKKSKTTIKTDTISKRVIMDQVRSSSSMQHFHIVLTAKEMARIMFALLHISPDVDYTTWVQIGMGLRNSFGDAAFPIWDNWSSRGSDYPGTKTLRAKWAGFEYRPDGVTVATLFHHAQDYGWNGKREYIKPVLPVRLLKPEENIPLFPTVDVETAQKKTLVTLRDALLKPKKGTTTAIRITTGVGKTYALKKLFTDILIAGKSITIVAKDRKQCEEYEKAGAVWRHGRERSEKGFLVAWHCPHAEKGGKVERLAEKEHRLQQMCRSGHCEHGNIYMRDKALADGRDPDPKIIRFFAERPEYSKSHPCGWFEHLHASQSAVVRVVSGAGLSYSDLIDQKKQLIDVLVIDESVEWAHSQLLNLKEVRGYIEALQELSKKSEDFDPELSGLLETPIAVFQDLAKKMGEHAAKSKKGAYSEISFDLADLVKKLEKATDDHGTALWEKPRWHAWLDLVSVPLRAFAAIKEGIKAKSLSLVDGQLHVTFLHPALVHARGMESPIIILDATLDATAQSFSDRIEHVVAESNIIWKIDPRWFKGAQNKKDDLDKEALDLQNTRKRMEKETGQSVFVICRRALAIHLIQKELHKGVQTTEEWNEIWASIIKNKELLWMHSIDLGIGWFGWHDVAHDEWNGWNGLIWGQHPVPDHVRLQEYADHRAALRLLGLNNALPLPNNEWLDRQEIITGEYAQTSKARLPAQKEVREWLLDRVAQKKIQAAGRSRSVWNNVFDPEDYDPDDPEDVPVFSHTHIWQVGGYPMVGLAEHGIRPIYTRLVNAWSKGEVDQQQHQKRMHLLDDAASLTIAHGKTISRDTLRESARELCNPLNDKEKKDIEPVRSSYIYILPDRTGSDAIYSNENNEIHNNDPRIFTENPAIWNGEYTLWRESCPAVFRPFFSGHDAFRPALIDMPELVSNQENVAAITEIQEVNQLECQSSQQIPDINQPIISVKAVASKVQKKSNKPALPNIQTELQEQMMYTADELLIKNRLDGMIMFAFDKQAWLQKQLQYFTHNEVKIVAQKMLLEMQNKTTYIPKSESMSQRSTAFA